MVMTYVKKMMNRFEPWTTFTTAERAIFMTEVTEMVDASKATFKKVMDKMKELKTTAKYDDMEAEAQQKFVASAMFVKGQMF